jgi:SAM-dependent methyltransferase
MRLICDEESAAATTRQVTPSWHPMYARRIVLPLAWLDAWVARHPFEGRTARRYARDERPAFGDLDARLLARLRPELATARRFLDVGAGDHELATHVAAAHPALDVLALEPSGSYTRAARAGVRTLRARAERVPLIDGAIDVAICMSSLRHVRERVLALRELRRVVRRGGSLHVVELDPLADATRSRRHRDALRSTLARLTFDPLLLRTCPTADRMAALALDAGWNEVTAEIDREQPVYLLRLR